MYTELISVLTIMARASDNSINSFLEEPDQRNWVAVAVGIKLTTNALGQYVKAGMQNLYSKMYRECSQQTVCTEDCSRNKDDPRTWCQTCTVWKMAILKYCRYKTHKEHIKWKLISLSNWSHPSEDNVEDVSRVFVRDLRNGTESVTKDMTSLLSIVHNCIFFDESFIISNILSDTRRIRNEFFAHSNCSLSSLQIHKSFDVLLRLLTHPRLQCYPATRIAVTVLKELKRDGLQCVLRNISVDQTCLTTHDPAAFSEYICNRCNIENRPKTFLVTPKKTFATVIFCSIVSILIFTLRIPLLEKDAIHLEGKF